MRRIIFILLIFIIPINNIHAIHLKKNKIICNPLDIGYKGRGSFREAADPTILTYKGEYWLFASKSGGYWHSNDLSKWHFVETSDLPTDDYAPTAVVIRDSIFFMASNPRDKRVIVYKTGDPKSGKWEIKDSLEIRSLIDPDLFLDDTGRLYFYWGCSDINPIYGIELDPITFKSIGKRYELISSNPNKYGWEVRGDYNRAFNEHVWIEGPWMNKFNDEYYLQYAVPGTQQKSYADGVYVSDNPLGPFKLSKNNPFAIKPEGFACGAGHGSTFYDFYGNLWHVGTVTISVKHTFERRLALYPAFLDNDGLIYTDTSFGDYPLLLPEKKIETKKDIFPNWMLLSYKKPVSVSSVFDGHESKNIVDEEIRTYWSAKSGNNAEWCQIDLEDKKNVNAIQINFAEQDFRINRRNNDDIYRYIIEYSNDKKNWNILIDNSNNNSNNSHPFFLLDTTIKARFFRLTNYKTPSGKLAISGFRIFGKGKSKYPHQVNNLNVKRLNDRRCALLSWNKINNAQGYLVRFGIDKNKLYQSYMVYDKNSLQINFLNIDQPYFFKVEPFNENGINKKGEIINIK